MVTFVLDSLSQFTPASNSAIPGQHCPLKTAWNNLTLRLSLSHQIGSIPLSHELLNLLTHLWPCYYQLNPRPRHLSSRLSWQPPKKISPLLYSLHGCKFSLKSKTKKKANKNKTGSRQPVLWFKSHWIPTIWEEMIQSYHLSMKFKVLYNLSSEISPTSSANTWPSPSQIPNTSLWWQ